MKTVYKVKKSKHEKIVLKLICDSDYVFDIQYHTKQAIYQNYGTIPYLKAYISDMIVFGGTSVNDAMKRLELIEGNDVLNIN